MKHRMHYKTLLPGFKIILSLVLVLIVAIVAPPIWRNLFTYPRLERQVKEFSLLRKQPPKVTELTTFRGIMHAHSYWSHDSEGTLTDILPAAKNAGIEFIFLTDHPHGNTDSFPRGYKGNYDGILIEPGSERQKLAVWPLQTTVIDWNMDRDSVIKQVTGSGGLLFYAHTEEPHDWDNPYYHGMEIYNFHADTKDEKLLPHIINFLVNGKKYRKWAMRELFNEQTAILSLWDSLNTHRKIVGYSAVDTHENQNIRARQLDNNRIQWVGPNAKPFATSGINFSNRWLFSEPDENGWVFKRMIDTYMEGFNHVVNYVMADTLSIESLAESIKQGHLYMAFQSLGDAHGFMYWSQNRAGTLTGILGDSVQRDEVSSLHAVSPLPGRYRLFRDGLMLDETSGEEYEYSWDKPTDKGAYRIEMHIKPDDKLVPWLYSNPIYIY